MNVHVDTDIGKQLSALGQTLTAITGDLGESQQFYPPDDCDTVDYGCLDNDVSDVEVGLASCCF